MADGIKRQSPSSSAEISDTDTADKKMEQTYDSAFIKAQQVFENYIAKGEDFVKKKEAYTKMSEQWSKQFVKVQDAYKEYAAAHIPYIEVGRKLLNGAPISDENLLQQILPQLPRNNPIEIMAAEMLSSLIQEPSDAVAQPSERNEEADLLNKKTGGLNDA